MKYLHTIGLLLLIMASASAYQQSYLEFTLDESWNVSEQRQAVQSFVKEGMYLEVRDVIDDEIDAEAFARSRGGEVISEETIGDVYEAVVVDAYGVFVLASTSGKGEDYAISLIAPLEKEEEAVDEMRALYETLSYSDTQNFVVADYEEKLEEVEGLSFSEKHPFKPVDTIVWIIIVILVFFIALKIHKRVRRKRPKDNEHAAKKDKKHKHKASD